MANYWKAKVLPTIKKVFTAGSAKKAAAAEATKTFDESKEGIDKEFEEKKTELQPKVLEIYEASSVDIKTLVKKTTPSELKKNSADVNKFLEELVKIAEFPGSKSVSEITTKFSPSLASGPVTYIFEKVAIFLPAEDPEKVEATAAAVEVASKEISVEDIKKEEVAEKVEEAPIAAAEPANPEATSEPAAVAAEPEKVAEEAVEAAEPTADPPAKAAEPPEEPAKA